MPVISEKKMVKLLCGSHKVAKIYCMENVVYASGNICTYHVDGVVYQEEVDEGASCLSPSSFALPEKPGYTFMGWSLESSGTVLKSLAMGDAPVTLYARWIASTLSVLSNPEYVTRVDGEWYDYAVIANAWINRSGYNNRSSNNNTGHIHIRLGTYKKAIVVIKPKVNNSTAWYDNNRHGQLWINGSSIYASNAQNQDSSPRTYTYTGDTTITLKASAWINGNNNGLYTYVGADLTVQSVTLSM